MTRGTGIRFELREALKQLDCRGHSKRAARHEQGTHNPSGIYSTTTLVTYQRETDKFAAWVRETHDCRHAAEALPHVSEYLRSEKARGLSDSTVTLARSALAKAYHVESSSFNVELHRSRDEITRGRGEITSRDTGHFSYERNRDILDFCKGTGCRANTDLGRGVNCHVKDLYEKDGHWYLHIAEGKGGRSRDVYIPAAYAGRIREIADQAERDRGRDGRIIEHVPCRLSSHTIRRDYARAMYADLERDPELRAHLRAEYAIPDRLTYRVDGVEREYQSDVIELRGKAHGETYSREICTIVSNALGHGDNRTSTIVNNYLR